MPFFIVRDGIEALRFDAVVEEAASEPVDTCAFSPAHRIRIRSDWPTWRGGWFGEKRFLAACYRRTLEEAKTLGCESLAIPLLAAQTGGYPEEQALRVAVRCIRAFLRENDMRVYLVLRGAERLSLSPGLAEQIGSYLDERWHAPRPPLPQRPARAERPPESDEALFSAAPPEEAKIEAPRPAARPEREAPGDMAAMPQAKRPALSHKPKAAREPAAAAPMSNADTAVLGGLLFELDESFQQMLLRKIDESGMTDAQCYKKANVDRKLFSKIRKDVGYRPSKPTAIAFAIALELDLKETESLLRKAGFALSNSSKFDVIVRYFIERRKYDIFEINEVLFYFDQSLLGA